jgi:hypothetical protein
MAVKEDNCGWPSLYLYGTLLPFVGVNNTQIRKIKGLLHDFLWLGISKRSKCGVNWANSCAKQRIGQL